jgi:hypothetical protein
MSNKRQTHKHKLAQQTRSSAEYKHNRKLILQDKPNCHWCNQRQATTADHLIEVDRWDHTQPGINSLDNLVPACKQCNSSRGARYGNLKKLQIYEPAPSVNINPKKNYADQRIFIQNTDDPDKASSLFNGLNTANQPKLELTDQDCSVHSYAAPYMPRLETGVCRDGKVFADGVSLWALEHLGVELMNWQKHVVSGFMAHDASGDLLHRQALVSVARQNGKSLMLQSCLGFWLTEMPKLRGQPQTVITTAHRLDLAIEMFQTVAPILEEKFGAILTWAVGRNEANLPDGTRWLVRAATPNSFHGLTADAVFIDELWAVSPDAVSIGLMPTMRTRRSPLMLMTSTSGDQSSVEMLRWREQGLRAIDEKKTGSLYFAEFSPPNSIDPMSAEAWVLANPAIGHTLSIAVLESEAQQPNRNAFLRSSVNLWTASANGWLQPGIWDELKTSEPMPKGGVLAIEQSQDESRYVGVRAALNSAGKIQVCLEFVKDTLQDCWQAVEQACQDQTTRLLITPAFEMSLPPKFARRSSMVGNRELQRWTAATRAAILEKRIVHDGSTLFAQHVERAVAVKNQGAVTLSSIRSPGPIELARCLVFATAMVSKPANVGKPTIIYSNG